MLRKLRARVDASEQKGKAELRFGDQANKQYVAGAFARGLHQWPKHVQGDG